MKKKAYSPFFGNYYCLIPKTNFAFVAIPKNAITFLKKIALYNKTNFWLEDDKLIHEIIGYQNSSPFLIPINQMHLYEKQNGKITKFAVWRDPVERVLSTYSLFCLQKRKRFYFDYLDLVDTPSFDRFIQFISFELSKTNVLNQDEHIRKQVDFIKNADLDFILPINKLETFLSEMKISSKSEKSNESLIRLKSSQISSVQIETIKKLYKDDYKIITNF